jgi:RimJ/RimL family protein N-acetyltransferase
MKIQNSERLSYQLMTADDAVLMHQLDQDPEVMRFINGGEITSLDEIVEVYLPRMATYTNPDKGWGIWKVMLKDSAEFIGWVLVRPMHFFGDNPEFDNLEMGWRFFKKCWGKGYATESANAIMQALIATADVKKLSAIAVEKNTASVKIMSKLGMKYIKTYFHKDPLFSSEVVYYELEV